MGTIITEIYEALARVAVVYEGAVVNVYQPLNMKNRINREALPLRILSPVGKDARPAVVDTMALDVQKTGRITWQVFDLFLIAPINAGDGLSQYGLELLTAQAAYIDAMTGGQITLIPRGARITGIQADAAVWRYNEVDYFGVEFQITISEILNG